MIKGIRRNEFNYWLENSHAMSKRFPGATVQELKHYNQHPLETDAPDIVILHACL